VLESARPWSGKCSPVDTLSPLEPWATSPQGVPDEGADKCEGIDCAKKEVSLFTANHTLGCEKLSL
jgi:hypothetical protein